MNASPEQPRESVWRELQPGELLCDSDRENYRIVHFLAEGGYSQVYKAVHERSGALVAIKVLHLRHARNKKTLRRQIQEANTLYELQHPNVVRVHAIGAREKDGMVFMVMDLLVGRTLRELVWDMGGKMPIPWTLKIMGSVGRGLSAIHQRVIVHRDLKPDNLHVRDDGHVSLFDLGTARIPKAARLTTRGYTLGTLDYMSPEQLLDPDSIDARSDLFSLGSMLYEALSGRNPFGGVGDDVNDKQAIGIRITMRPHPPLLTVPGAQHVPSYVAAIVERLLEKSPADRYRSAEVVADLLEGALAKYEHDLRAKGLTLQPLSKLAEIPRRPQPKEDEEDAAATSSTSTSPFVSISIPPEEAEKRRGSLRRSGPRARSVAYASTEKMQVGAYTLPNRPAIEAAPPVITSRQENVRATMLPFIMGADEVADEDIEEVTEDGEPLEEKAAQGAAEWSFESVAKIERERTSLGPGSAKERMFDPEGAAPLPVDTDTLTPHEASFAGSRSRPTMAMRVPKQRSTLASVAVVLVVAMSVAVLGLVLLSIVSGGQLRRAGEARPAAAQSTADAGALDGATADGPPLRPSDESRR
ncbi:MAG: serine/threonine-protein kinase [Minicystis sp.]